MATPKSGVNRRALDLLGDDFTIADLNLSGVMLLFQMIAFDISAYPNVKRWIEACYARPSLATAQARP